MFKRLDAKLEEFLTLGVPWNDCVVYHKGECVYRAVRGSLDLEGKNPAKGCLTPMDHQGPWPTREVCWKQMAFMVGHLKAF